MIETWRIFELLFKYKQIREEALPSNHPNLATVYNNLMISFSDQEKLEESFELLFKMHIDYKISFLSLYTYIFYYKIYIAHIYY